MMTSICIIRLVNHTKFTGFTVPILNVIGSQYRWKWMRSVYMWYRLLVRYECRRLSNSFTWKAVPLSIDVHYSCSDIFKLKLHAGLASLSTSEPGDIYFAHVKPILPNRNYFPAKCLHLADLFSGAEHNFISNPKKVTDNPLVIIPFQWAKYFR